MEKGETLALWKRCDDARGQAIAEGKSPLEAHAAATRIWNQFAREEADFSGTAFYNSFLCSGWIFPGGASFREVKFLERADFSSARFEGMADFTNARFEGMADFGSVKFTGHARFSGASFGRESDFRRMSADRDFTLARTKFGEVPEFNNARFAQMPSFDGVTIRSKTRWDELPKLYSKLEGLADKNGDKTRAQEFRTARLESEKEVARRKRRQETIESIVQTTRAVADLSSF